MSIGTLIKTIQDIMRKDVGVDGDAQRISQIVWLLFLKIFDDKEQEWQLTIPGYKSPLQSRFRWSNWAKDAEGITGEELIDFVNNELFPSLKKLATAAGVSPSGRVVGSVFEDAYNYMKSGTLLRQVINAIESDVDFNSSSDRHLFNDIYEKILADLQSAGNAGEYYTPRAVTQFMVDILNPQLGESVLDPACGTGGFLTCTIDHLKAQVKTSADRTTLQNCIHGVEKKPLPHMLAMTNLMLHGIDVPSNIRHDNTLSRPLKDYGPKDRVDIILTNPPFGGMEEDGIENNFPRKYQTRETADLFMALIMHLLKHDTGRAAVVLPDGFLFGEGAKTTLKRELLEEFNLHTIVRLPKGVFAPYTSIATNVLFFEKGEPTKDVWFFEHPYPNGYKSYSRSKPLDIKEFDLEKAWWGGPTRKSRKTTENAWKISAADIATRNYNLDCKNPHAVEINHRAPADLMAEYQEITRQLTEAQNALKAELMLALGGAVMELLEQHFDTAFSAPNGIQKLRELIVTLAMQGKLVPQDPREATASQLLKEIEAEKKRLAKEGKIKAPKPLPEITFSDAPYTLPQGWQWVRLGSVGNIFNGNSINASEKEAKYAGAKGLPYIATKDVGYGFDPLDYENGICIPVGEDKFRLAHEGAVLICAEGGSAGKKCGLTDRDICFGNKLFANELYGQISSRFILYTYLSPVFRASFAAAMSGIIGGVSIAKFVEIPIPLPPLDEQHRIVAKIDQLMARCDALENLRNEREKKRLATHAAALSQLLDTTGNGSADDAWAFITQHFGDLYAVKENVTELRKAILQLAITGKLTERRKDDLPVKELLKKIKLERSRLLIRGAADDQVDSRNLSYSIPDGWALLPLDATLISGPTNGYSPRAVDYETKVKSLTLSATTSGVFKGEHSKFIADDIPANSDLWLQDGDILVQRGNTIEYVGVPAIYRGERNIYIYPDLMMKLRVSTELDCDYVCFAMSAAPSRDFLRERASGTSGTMPKINQRTLTSLPIPIPPLEEQRRIVEKINRLIQQCNQLDTQINAANLKSSELLNALMAQV